MIDNFNMDGHKLMYHISRLYKWLQGENVYPIYADIGLAGGCNHRCIFCTFDYLGYELEYIDKGCMERSIEEASEEGLKSILYAGEGEPLLHRQADEIIEFTKKKGIDVALSTNGVFLNKDTADRILPYLSWVRVSVNAGTSEKYSFIHGCDTKDFNTVLGNIKYLVKRRNQKRYPCVIGIQSLLLPQNYEDILNLAKIASQIGVDYLSIKPFSRHPNSDKNFDYSKISPEKLSLVREKLFEYQRNNFRIIYRQNSIDRIREDKHYNKCLGFSFTIRINAKGDVFPCIAFEGRQGFILGNICKDSFREVWEGNRRKRIIEDIYSHWDVENCRKPCRLDEINRYLWDLKNPVKHVNFI